MEMFTTLLIGLHRTLEDKAPSKVCAEEMAVHHLTAAIADNLDLPIHSLHIFSVHSVNK